MNEKIVKAKIELDKIAKNRQLVEEFEKLGPKPYFTIFGIILTICAGWILEYYFNQTLVTFPIFGLILYLAIRGESEVINRRIDILYKLVFKQHTI